MSERLVKRFLNAELLGLCLVMTAIEVMLYGVEAAIADTHTGNLFWICLISAAIGFAGGAHNWKSKQLSAAIVVLGLIGVWIIGARIATPIIDLLRSLVQAGPQIVPHIDYRFGIDARSIAAAWETISLASSALIARWNTWLLASPHSWRVNDALLRNMLWTLALWLLSAWIGWFAAKRNGIASLLPGVALLTMLLWSNERRIESLWAFVMIMLLLMGIWNYRTHTQNWEIRLIDYSDSIRIDISQYLLMVALAVGVISYTAPSISWRDIRDYFREHEQPTQNQTAATPASNNMNATAQAGKLLPKSSLPREHLLTAGSAQSQAVVMTISSGELPPVAMQSLEMNVPRYYWRSVVYDRYDGRGWLSTSAPPQPIPANEPMIAGVLSGYKLLHLNVQMQRSEAGLYWSGMLYSSNVPLKVDWRLRPQSNLFADQTDLLQADMFAARTDATSYQVESFVPIPSIEQLRAAPAEPYPQPIRNLYLSLPETLPRRVHLLARQITAGSSTPYDQAKAIETYLRTNYPYDLEISAPPADRDVTDYFLFDLKRGYCDYYATAMVVLARSSGIPARFVSGYASGDYDVSNAEYVVRELHAHSWAEVYFPEIGWIEFEPTGNQPEIEREETSAQVSATDGSRLLSRGTYLQLANWKMAVLLISFGIVLAIVINFALIEPFFFARLAPQAAIEVLYQRFYRSARPLAGARTRAETAYEFTNKLLRNMQQMNADLGRSAEKLQQDVQILATIYQDALFSNHSLERHDVRTALHLWNRIRWSLIVERTKHFFWIATNRQNDRIRQ